MVFSALGYWCSLLLGHHRPLRDWRLWQKAQNLHCPHPLQGDSGRYQLECSFGTSPSSSAEQAEGDWKASRSAPWFYSLHLNACFNFCQSFGRILFNFFQYNSFKYLVPSQAAHDVSCWTSFGASWCSNSTAKGSSQARDFDWCHQTDPCWLLSLKFFFPLLPIIIWSSCFVQPPIMK